LILARVLTLAVVLTASRAAYAAFDGDELPMMVAWLGTVPLGLIQLIIASVARRKLRRSAAPWTILATLASFGLALVAMGSGASAVKGACFVPGIPLLVLWSEPRHEWIVALLAFAVPPLLLVLSI
jgi:hypothetical protein